MEKSASVFFRTFRIAKPHSKFRFNVWYCQSPWKAMRYIHFGPYSMCWRDQTERRHTSTWSADPAFELRLSTSTKVLCDVFQSSQAKSEWHPKTHRGYFLVCPFFQIRTKFVWHEGLNLFMCHQTHKFSAESHGFTGDDIFFRGELVTMNAINDLATNTHTATEV